MATTVLFLLCTETCKMYISDKAVKCDNKILFNPVIYILIFVRLYVNGIIHQNTEKQLKMDGLFNLVRLFAEGDLAEGRRGHTVILCHYVGTKIEFWNFSITKNVCSVCSYM